MPQYPASLDLDDPDDDRVVSYPITDSDSGSIVSNAGDVNGDGIADIIVSVDVAQSYEPDWANYVVFGTDGPLDPDFSLDQLDGSNGFKVEGRSGWLGGIAVSVGDLNGDGRAEIGLVTTNTVPGDHSWSDLHVIFGTDDGHGGSIAIDDIDGVNGFTLIGPQNDRAWYMEFSAAGDINGDGYDDLMAGGSNNERFLFGKADGFVTDLNVINATVDPVFRSQDGYAPLGDINNDGYDDMMLGRIIYYGRADDEAAMASRGPFKDHYSYVNDVWSPSGFDGREVSAAGDVNGDGIDDFIISNGYSSPHGHTRGGEAFVVFGRNGVLPTNVSLASLDGTDGFAIRGEYFWELGTKVSGAGDINGDGFDDVIVASTRTDEAWVVFGRSSYHTPGFDAVDLDGTYGFKIENTGDDWVTISSVHGIGDINSDGFDDIGFGEFPASIYDDSQIHFLMGQRPTDSVYRADAAGDQTVRGGTASDTLVSYGGDDHLVGDAGNDRLVSAAGTDTLDGGLGDDTYIIYRDLNDIIVDAGGNDTIEAKTSVNLGYYEGIENLTFSTAGNWLGYGNELDNTIAAGAGNNRLFGAAGDDTLSGGAGNDLLSGGAGRDVLSGGIGADRFDFFDFETGLGGDRNVITDFADGIDTINLGYMDANLRSPSNQTFSFIGEADFSGAAGELRYGGFTYTNGTEVTLVEGDTNSDGLTDFQIELRGVNTLTAGDFIL